MANVSFDQKTYAAFDQITWWQEDPTGLFAKIYASGSTDVTAPIQAIIDGAADGATLQFPANAVYGIDGQLHVDSRNDLTFVGNGVVLKQLTAGTAGVERDLWTVTNSSHCSWRNFTMIGSNANGGLADNAFDVTREHQHGWAFYGSDHIDIGECDVSYVFGDFVYLSHFVGGDNHLSDTIAVHDNTFHNNGRQCFSITGAQNVTYSANTITNIRQTVLDLEPSSPHGEAHSVLFQNNTVGPFRQQFFAGSGGNTVPAMSNITLDSNTLTDTGSQGALKIVFGVDATTRTNFTVTNNVANTVYHSSSGYLIGPIDNVAGVTVTGNTQPFTNTGDMNLVAVHNCTSVNVTGNTILNGVGQVITI